MHEISLVRQILRTLEQEFPDRTHLLHRIHLKAGLLSNVQPLLMQSAFQAVLQDEPRYARVLLEVEQLPILVRCDTCGTVSQVEHYRFVCPCGQPCRDIVQGDELLIGKVEFWEE